MKININNEIGEKDTKQVISSFKRLVRYILYTFSQDLLDKKDKSLEITFDNNEQFYVGIAFTDNKDEIIAGYTYFDAYGNELEEISLQQILNINKYSLNIQNMLKEDNYNYKINAYFTEQTPFDIKIFKENDVGLEQKLKDEDIGEINIDNVNEEIHLV